MGTEDRKECKRIEEKDCIEEAQHYVQLRSDIYNSSRSSQILHQHVEPIQLTVLTLTLRLST